MIHEEICTYEVAKLAKEKGFNLYCFPFYALEDFTVKHVDNVGEFYKFDFEKGDLYLNYYVRSLLCKDKILPAPTQSLLQRWLREEKKIYVCPCIISDYEDDYTPHIVYWSFIIVNTESGDSIYREYERVDEKRFDTYELALEDALKYALEKLV